MSGGRSSYTVHCTASRCSAVQGATTPVPHGTAAAAQGQLLAPSTQLSGARSVAPSTTTRPPGASPATAASASRRRRLGGCVSQYRTLPSHCAALHPLHCPSGNEETTAAGTLSAAASLSPHSTPSLTSLHPTAPFTARCTHSHLAPLPLLPVRRRRRAPAAHLAHRCPRPAARLRIHQPRLPAGIRRLPAPPARPVRGLQAAHQTGRSSHANRPRLRC